jgi:ABC-type oligopeptide transport system substrate-binding subunit
VHFRQGFSLAIDRTRFAAAYTSAGAPGYGILNDMYIHDPYTGASYRSSEAAKNALVRLYGLEFGPDGDYATLDDAYAAITGFDPELARSRMQLAFEETTASGLYDGESPVVLQLSVFQNEDTYVQMYHFLQDALENACKGTGFEGKVSLTMVVDEDYYATMESGLTDMIFSTWGGDAYSPYGLLYNCYCDAGVKEYPNQMEYGFDAAAVTVTIRLDEADYTATLQDWARWCAGEPQVTITDADGTALPAFRLFDSYSRSGIYADLEWAYLSQFVTTPLYYRNNATLLSQKGSYPTSSYLNLLEFGGIAFYQFHYTDEQWEAIKGEMNY